MGDDELKAQLKRVADGLEWLINRYKKADAEHDQEEQDREKRGEAFRAFRQAKKAYLDGEIDFFDFRAATEEFKAVVPDGDYDDD